jgi:hypothetical protein
MDVRKRFLAAVALAVFLVTAGCSSGCAVRTTGPPLTTAQQITFTTAQSLAAVAAVNKALAVDVIAIADAGLIKKDQANAVLTWQRTIALDIVAAVTIRRDATKTDVEKALAIKTAFLNAANLPPEVAALIGSAQTDQAVTGLITTVQTIIALVRALSGGVA